MVGGRETQKSIVFLSDLVKPLVRGSEMSVSIGTRRVMQQLLYEKPKRLPNVQQPSFVCHTVEIITLCWNLMAVSRGQREMKE